MSQLQQQLKKVSEQLPALGLTTLESQATFLALSIVYCKLVPKIKSCEYSTVEELKSAFPRTFANVSADKIVQWLNYESANKGTLAAFYNYVYDPDNDGKDIGNRYYDDGYTFAECGFLPIVGRNQFERYQQIVDDKNKNALKSAQALINDFYGALQTATLQFKDVMKGVPAGSHPQFLYEGIARFTNIVDNAEKRKHVIACYEKLYNAKLNESYGFDDKTAGNEVIPNTYYGSDIRSHSYGFGDPSGKYPYNRVNGQSSINSLSKGQTQNSIITKKQNTRRIAIPVADGSTWDQPHSAYAAVYPYNVVKETESGHFEEWDDTPGHERIHRYHRKGTFEEIDQNGSKVVRIVGDQYTIVDRNGFVSIEGRANVTVSGNINVLCLSDANVKVEGSAKMDVGGSMDIGVAKDFTLACGGDIKLWANGTMNVQSAQSMHLYTEEVMYAHSEKDINLTSDNMTKISSRHDMHISGRGNVNVSSDKDVNIISDNDMYITSGKDTNIVVSGSCRHDVQGDRHNKTGGSLYEVVSNATNQHYNGYWHVTSDSEVDIHSGGSTRFDSQSNMYIKTGSLLGIQSSSGTMIKGGSQVAIDASKIHLNSGVASLSVPGATQAAGILGGKIACTAMNGTKAIKKGLTSPMLGAARYSCPAPFESVQPIGEREFAVESENDFNTVAAKQSLAETLVTEISTNIHEGPIEQPITNDIPYEESENFIEIMNTDPSMFTSDFRISKHFTLGMMFDGGFNNKHRLRPQGGLSVNQIVSNLSALANNVLEKAIDLLPGGISGYRKQWNITSGYRQGSGNSDHVRGRACDIQIVGRNKKQHWEFVCALQKVIDYDQLLLEYRGQNSVWVHVGYRRCSDKTQNVTNRHMAKTYVDDRSYCDGFQLITRC